jgi:hypothetical protein
MGEFQLEKLKRENDFFLKLNDKKKTKYIKNNLLINEEVS